jgi:hypothetical protein
VKRSILFLLLVLAGLAGTFLWWAKFESRPPSVSFEVEPKAVGRHARWDMTVRAFGRPGLRHIEVRLIAGGQAYQLFTEDFPARSWIGSRVNEGHVHVDADLGPVRVPEGAAELQVLGDTYAWHLVPRRAEIIAERDVTVDLTPPRAQLLTTQHNLRLGGSSVALFRVSPDTTRAGIAVGNYFFPAVRGYFADPAIALAIFAVPQDLSADVQPELHLEDEIGNVLEVAVPCHIRNRHFQERTLEISKSFLQRKVPEIYAANGLTPPADLVQGYLFINGDLRRQSEQKLRALTVSSVGEPLWDGAFRRQSNAAAMSTFADRRSYVYEGRIIDHQTHLGYDLASLRLAPVEASQNGIVVYADNLGIYGNTVVLDHGLGVFSLYGHMSTLAVQPGQKVEAGETLGQTGETGLAGGDHLHFSILLHGIQVDPVEWWDPHWLRDHVTAKLHMFPRASDEGAGSREKGDGQGQS